MDIVDIDPRRGRKRMVTIVCTVDNCKHHILGLKWYYTYSIRHIHRQTLHEHYFVLILFVRRRKRLCVVIIINIQMHDHVSAIV